MKFGANLWGYRFRRLATMTAPSYADVCWAGIPLKRLGQLRLVFGAVGLREFQRHSSCFFIKAEQVHASHPQQVRKIRRGQKGEERHSKEPDMELAPHRQPDNQTLHGSRDKLPADPPDLVVPGPPASREFVPAPS